MKIAHIGDVHWGLNYPGPSPEARFNDITKTMDWAADRIIDERCDLVLFAGDAFKDARVYLDRASVEIKAFVNWLRKITTAGIPVVVISGTPSHDAISAYHLIAEMQIPFVNVFTTPGISSVGNIDIVCLPGMNRSSLVAQEGYRTLPPHQIHQIMTDKITETCQGLREQCKGSAILLSHLSYDMADKGFEDVLMQHEPVLTQEAIQGFDLVTLGHIHRPQRNGNVFYCGSPERLSFNDEKIQAGFWIHDIDLELPYDNIDSTFIEAPARRFATLGFDQGCMEGLVQHGIYYFGSIIEEQIKNAIIRLHYSCSEDINKILDRKALERALMDAGAFYVAEIKADVQRVDRARDQEVTESLGPVEALAKWAGQQGIEAEETAALQSMTTGLLEEVAA
ncbi:MAG: metallophosphoesterase [Desulfotomaculaceae bacterium]|nr:metallophosphoesterase [Desulfotomaculaceae bacterium]